jgi:hypothetical protein
MTHSGEQFCCVPTPVFAHLAHSTTEHVGVSDVGGVSDADFA